MQMKIRIVCLSIPAASLHRGPSRMRFWRSSCSLRMCTALAQEQVILGSPPFTSQRLEACGILATSKALVRLLDAVRCLVTPRLAFSKMVRILSMLPNTFAVRARELVCGLQEKVHTFTVPAGSQKRLDAFLSVEMQSTSRARLQNIIKGGYVAVNGKPASKAGQGLRQGDTVTCELPPAAPIEASPEVTPSMRALLWPLPSASTCHQKARHVKLIAVAYNPA